MFFSLSWSAPASDSDLNEFIHHRLQSANTDPSAPPFDSVREYAYEGAGSVAGELSSVASTDDSGGGSDGGGQWDELGNWGPRFHRLADVYGMDCWLTDTEINVITVEKIKRSFKRAGDI